MSREFVAELTGAPHGHPWRIGLFLSCAVAVLVGAIACAETAADDDAGLQGVWRLEEMLIVDADGQATRSPVRASQYIFTNRHYSMMLRLGDDTLPPFAELWNPTDEERLESYNRLGANAGSYELDGAVMTLHPVVARGDEMGGQELLEVDVSADTLRLAIVGLIAPNGTANQFYASGGSTLLRLVRMH